MPVTKVNIKTLYRVFLLFQFWVIKLLLQIESSRRCSQNSQVLFFSPTIRYSPWDKLIPAARPAYFLFWVSLIFFLLRFLLWACEELNAGVITLCWLAEFHRLSGTNHSNTNPQTFFLNSPDNCAAEGLSGPERSLLSTESWGYCQRWARRAASEFVMRIFRESSGVVTDESCHVC